MVVLVIAALLPPLARPPEPVSWAPRYPAARGAYHIHSNRSDGTGTLDEIAAAAATAGLSFAIITDHGDGTRRPEPPAYRAGVLVIDAVEISTSGGHYVAFGLPQSPFRLAGTPESVIEDVKRLGGFGIAAHPDSAKTELRWTDWRADLDGLEWLNADSEWRDELWGSLGRGLLTYFFRPAETLATFLGRPQPTLARWDDLGRTRRLIGLAGADAHARLGFRQTVDPYEERVIARVPGYVASFEAFQNHVMLDRPLAGDAPDDAETILRGIRAGRVYTTIDGLAGAGAFDFLASSGRRRADMGGYLDPDGDVVIEARVAAPPGTRMVLLRDGQPAYDAVGPTLTVDVGAHPGVYRIEARLADMDERTRVPWLVSNPIYVGLRHAHRGAMDAAPVRRAPASTHTGIDVSRWRPEASAGSTSSVAFARPDDASVPLVWQFALANDGQPAPYAAAQFPMDGGLTDFDRVRMVVSAARPMRLWAQIRSPATGERWGRTFYVDEVTRDVTLFFDEFEPLGPTLGPPTLAEIDSLLIVADALNHRAGDAGALRIQELWREK